MVRMVGLEPTRLSSQGPKPCVSTISPHPQEYSVEKTLPFILTYFNAKAIYILQVIYNTYYTSINQFLINICYYDNKCYLFKRYNMYNIIKFLLVPITMIGINISNCYSMEIEDDNDVVDENAPTIKYMDQTTTWDQWTTYQNFEAIDVNGQEYSNIIEFCDKHKLYSFKNEIKYLLINIYKLAHALNGNGKILRIYKNYSNSLHDIIELWTNKNIDGSLSDFHYFVTAPITTEPSLTNAILSIINFQKKLNKTKYLNSNEINNIPKTESIDIQIGCSYIANKLVQLSHDIIYAINNTINEYQNKKISNENIYEYFKNYLINDITIQCYKSISDAFSYFVCKYDGGVMLNNISISGSQASNDTIEGAYENVESVIERNLDEFKQYKYNFIYEFSKLGKKLSENANEIINTLNKALEEVKIKTKGFKSKDVNNALSNIIEEFKNLSFSSILEIYHHGGGKTIENINNTDNITEKQIIEIANDYTQSLLKYINDTVNNINKKYKLDSRKLQNEEEILYQKEMKDLINKLETKFNELKIHENSNTNYLEDIKKLLIKFSFVD